MVNSIPLDGLTRYQKILLREIGIHHNVSIGSQQSIMHPRITCHRFVRILQVPQEAHYVFTFVSHIGFTILINQRGIRGHVFFSQLFESVVPELLVRPSAVSQISHCCSG